jgi:hypothetical protein
MIQEMLEADIIQPSQSFFLFTSGDGYKKGWFMAYVSRL